MRNSKKQHNLSTFFVQSIDIGPVSVYGGNVAGGAIGVLFTEKVAVDATVSVMGRWQI